MIEAEYVINPDAGDFELDNGKHLLVGIQASEKLYQDFELKVTNPGGHSSLPTSENAIYQLAEGLTRLEKYQFPFELNEVTREYFEREADIVGGQTGADMKGILKRRPIRPHSRDFPRFLITTRGFAPLASPRAWMAAMPTTPCPEWRMPT